MFVILKFFVDVIMSNSPNSGSRCNVSFSVTPKSENKKSRSSISGFSPVSVPDSPASPKTVNLTGNPRRIRDNAAELFNLIEDWNTHQLEGVSCITDIINLKFSLAEDDACELTRDYPPGISSLLENLDDTSGKMNDIIERMKVISKELHSISKLEYFRTTTPTPMFLTWPPEKYGESADIITEAYSKQLKLQFYIKENIAHCFNKSNAILYSAAWLYQPYIEDSINLLLEAMLKETGLK
ncbi:cyclin-dependent kinase 2-interacting protein-like [Lycorma delicatula]|uniref:cyclin-dependent kinase 2-interacting protein-like n=1 Tax=Lycorma delicatula TaxID=130591 RepID=UPI003F51A569